MEFKWHQSQGPKSMAYEDKLKVATVTWICQLWQWDLILFFSDAENVKFLQNMHWRIPQQQSKVCLQTKHRAARIPTNILYKLHFFPGRSEFYGGCTLLDLFQTRLSHRCIMQWLIASSCGSCWTWTHPNATGPTHRGTCNIPAGHCPI